LTTYRGMVLYLVLLSNLSEVETRRTVPGPASEPVDGWDGIRVDAGW
jgi:hypothetical protein